MVPRVDYASLITIYKLSPSFSLNSSDLIKVQYSGNRWPKIVSALGKNEKRNIKTVGGLQFCRKALKIATLFLAFIGSTSVPSWVSGSPTM